MKWRLENKGLLWFQDLRQTRNRFHSFLGDFHCIFFFPSTRLFACSNWVLIRDNISGGILMERNTQQILVSVLHVNSSYEESLSSSAFEAHALHFLRVLVRSSWITINKELRDWTKQSSILQWTQFFLHKLSLCSGLLLHKLIAPLQSGVCICLVASRRECEKTQCFHCKGQVGGVSQRVSRVQVDADHWRPIVLTPKDVTWKTTTTTQDLQPSIWLLRNTSIIWDVKIFTKG